MQRNKSVKIVLYFLYRNIEKKVPIFLNSIVRLLRCLNDNHFQDKTVKVSLNKNASAKDFESFDKNFHARYGNNLLPLSPSIRIPKVSKTKH